MKRLFALILTLLPLFLAAAILDIETVEKRDFRIGENIVFTVTVKDDAGKILTSGNFVLSIKDSGRKVLDTIKVDLSERSNPFQINAKLDRPGFVFISASEYCGTDGKTQKWKYSPFYPYGGAAVEPEKIESATAYPSDFESFWQDGLKSFESAQLLVEPLPQVKYEGYRVNRITVKFPDGSGMITGFLSIPSAKGKYPALVSVPGAGPGSVSPKPLWYSPVPAIELWMNVHLFATADNVHEQNRRYREYNNSFPGKAYYLHDAEDRDKYIYRRVWLALSRAIDYVTEMPEFDGRHFAATGNSQGGGTALALGYLNKNITCIVASVPALCDHGGWQVERMPGWPLLHFTREGAADQASAYFDGANFARRIYVPVLMSVGFVDTTCFPSSVFAAYNRIPSKNKSIYRMYRYGHRSAPEFGSMVQDFLRRELTK